LRRYASENIAEYDKALVDLKKKVKETEVGLCTLNQVDP
jgi:hypothetical protein